MKHADNLLDKHRQRGAGAFEGVFARVLSGEIPAFRQPGKVGVSAIYVDVDMVLEITKSA